MTKIPFKTLKWPKYIGNTKMIKIILKPKNNSNNPQASKMIQITPEPPKYQNDQNTLKTTKIPWNAKMILIHPKLIKLPKYPENHEN